MNILPIYVSYIAKFPGVVVNLDKMLFDYEVIKSNVVAGKFYLMQDNKYAKEADLLEYTVNIVEYIRKTVPFNTLTYEVLAPNTAARWNAIRDKFSHHIPLVTNQGCWTVYENNTFHMPADGTIYTVNTSNGHSFINAGGKPRVHLTIDLID